MATNTNPFEPVARSNPFASAWVSNDGWNASDESKANVGFEGDVRRSRNETSGLAPEESREGSGEKGNCLATCRAKCQVSFGLFKSSCLRI